MEINTVPRVLVPIPRWGERHFYPSARSLYVNADQEARINAGEAL